MCYTLFIYLNVFFLIDFLRWLIKEIKLYSLGWIFLDITDSRESFIKLLETRKTKIYPYNVAIKHEGVNCLKPHFLISSDIQHNARWLLAAVIRRKKSKRIWEGYICFIVVPCKTMYLIFKDKKLIKEQTVFHIHRSYSVKTNMPLQPWII